MTYLCIYFFLNHIFRTLYNLSLVQLNFLFVDFVLSLFVFGHIFCLFNLNLLYSICNSLSVFCIGMFIYIYIYISISLPALTPSFIYSMNFLASSTIYQQLSLTSGIQLSMYAQIQISR
jgi:hypothetical protein